MKKNALFYFEYFFLVHYCIIVLELDRCVFLDVFVGKSPPWSRNLTCLAFIRCQLRLCIAFNIDVFNGALALPIWTTVAWNCGSLTVWTFIDVLSFLLLLHAKHAGVAALVTGFVFVANWKVCFTFWLGALILERWGHLDSIDIDALCTTHSCLPHTCDISCDHDYMWCVVVLYPSFFCKLMGLSVYCLFMGVGSCCLMTITVLYPSLFQGLLAPCGGLCSPKTTHTQQCTSWCT